MIKLHAILLSSSIIFSASAAAWQQSPVALTPPAVDEAPEKVATPADAAYETLEKELRDVNTSLINKGGVEPIDKPILTALAARVDEFAKQFPDDERGPAAQLLVAEWLGEQDRISALYGQLLLRTPSNQQLRLAYAQRLKDANQYGEAVSVLTGQAFDDTRVVEAMKLLSDCLFAENRFTESVDALKTLSPEVLAANPALKPQIDQDMKTRLEYIDFWNAEQAVRQAEEQANDLPRVVLATPRGPITLELFENEAPNTVANFIKLSEDGFYNGTEFHRVLANFMAQGGDPNSKPDASAGAVAGQGGPGYTIADEYAAPNARKHFAGTLSMANTGAPNSGGSQFFITHQPTPFLNGKHTVFGRVIDGLPAARSLKQDDVLESATVLRKREHPYVPQTISAGSPPSAEPGSLGNPIELTNPKVTPTTTPQ